MKTDVVLIRVIRKKIQVLQKEIADLYVNSERGDEDFLHDAKTSLFDAEFSLTCLLDKKEAEKC